MRSSACRHVTTLRGISATSYLLRRYQKVKQSYSSTLSLTSALDGGWVVNATPRPLYPGKKWYPLYRRRGGPQGRSGRVRKVSPPTGIFLCVLCPFICTSLSWLPCLCLLSFTLQHTQHNIHAHGGIRTRNPSKQLAADPRLRPFGHWDRLDSIPGSSCP